MKLVAVFLALVATACNREVPTSERLLLKSGRSIEVVGVAVLGSGTERHTWFEYKSDASLPGPLTEEIRDVWQHIRAGQEQNQVPLVFVGASARRRSLILDGLEPRLVLRERGCISYTRAADGSWTESPLQCCRMGACDARGDS